MTPSATELRLGLAARAENLALVRQALSGLADGAAIAEGPLADLKQIATEACMNAVVHAYPNGEEGRIDVVVVATDASVELRVRDWGVGFRPRPAEPDGSLRLGLPLIATIADSFEIASPPDGGTSLVARVRLEGSNGGGELAPRPNVPKQAEMAITAGVAARPVIARVFAIAGTRAGFSLDRMSDGVLLGDAIAAGDAADFAESRVGIEIEECGPSLCMRVGPFVGGGAHRMLERMELPGLGVSISKLADRVEVRRHEHGEYLEIEIAPEPGT
jgi:anti-sigma regulatory factor (Ser/Thr protein kinase)